MSTACLSVSHIENSNLRLQTTKVESVQQDADADKPRNAFRGQSRSPNIVTFHMLGIVSSYASLRRAGFPIFDFKICRDLEIRVRGHSRSLKMVLFDRLYMISY